MTSRLSLWSTLLLAAALAWIAPGTALSQPAGAQGEDFLYRTMPGDTLLGLAQRFTTTPANWTTLQELNAISEPRQLPMGKILRIPLSLIPVVPASVRTDHVSGQVLVDGSPLRFSTPVEEGAVLSTGEDGFATLILDDGSIISVNSHTTIRLPRVRAFRYTGLTDTILSVEAGSIESVVAPEETGVGRFEIQTPVTVTGVRGTRLRVHSDDGGSRTEVLKGQAQLGASQSGQALLATGQGAATGADGKLAAVRALPVKPELAAPERSALGWALVFQPVPGATSYLVQVADDAQGTRLYSSERFSTPKVTFRAPGAGTYYVLVRAIEGSGLMGQDASQPFPGQSELSSSDGRSITTGYGAPVLLTYY